MKFIFDCEDEICLPAAYRLVGDLKPYLEKIKAIDLPEGDEGQPSRRVRLKAIFENVMVKYPKETSALLSRLWILDEGEKAPNSFKTMAVLFNNEVAVDFFTSVLPSLLQISKELLATLK